MSAFTNHVAHYTKYRLHFVAGLASVVLGIAACLPDPLEVRNIPVLAPEIVVNTQIIPDESLVVLLTRTFGALEASDDSDPRALIEQIAVNDALVVIDGPGSRDTLLHLGNGIYGGVELSFQPGEEYQLYVSSPTMGEVTATTRAVEQVRFRSLEAERYFNGFDDTLVQVNYAILDPLEDNYYMINVQRISINSDVVDQVLNPRVYTKVIDDAAYNGESIVDTLRATPRDYAAGDTVAVFLSNIDSVYYQFIKLRLDNRLGFVEFVSEPINYPSNVQGGRGFFNLYIPDIRIFILE